MIRCRNCCGAQKIFSIGNPETGSLVVTINIYHWRAPLSARLKRYRTTASEKATCRQVNSAGYLTFKNVTAMTDLGVWR